MRELTPHLVKGRQALVYAYSCKTCGSYQTAGTFMSSGASRETIEYAIRLKAWGYTYKEVAALVGKREKRTYFWTTIKGWIGRFAPDLPIRRGMRPDSLTRLLGLRRNRRKRDVKP